MKRYKVLQAFSSEGHPDFVVGAVVSLDESFAAPHVADGHLAVASEQE